MALILAALLVRERGIHSKSLDGDSEESAETGELVSRRASIGADIPELRGLAVLALVGLVGGLALARTSRALVDQLGDLLTVALGILQLIVAVAALSIGLISDDKLERAERSLYLARVRRAAVVSGVLLFTTVLLRLSAGSVKGPSYWLKAACLVPTSALAMASFGACMGVTVITVRALAPKESEHA